MTPIIQKAPESVTAELIANQQEESDHIELWERFASALGVSNEELEQCYLWPRAGGPNLQGSFGLGEVGCLPKAKFPLG